MQIRHARKGDEHDLARLLEEMERHYGKDAALGVGAPGDRKSTRLNSLHDALPI